MRVSVSRAWPPRRARLACAVATLGLLSGCGSGAARGSSTHAGGAPGTSASQQQGATGTQPQGATGTQPQGATAGAQGSACGHGARTLCITAADQGRTLSARVGWTVTVDLHAAGRRFSAPMQTGAKLLVRIAPLSQADGGVDTSYRALAPGATRLEAFERPVCNPGSACPDYIALWQVQLQVSRARRP